MFQGFYFKLRFLTIIFVLTTSSLAFAQTSPQSTPSLVEHPSPESDHAAEKILRNIIGKTEALSEVKASVDSGVILLNGTVSSKKDVDAIKEIANKLPGIVTVLDKTEMKAATFTDFSPMWREFQRLIDRSKTLLPSILIGLGLLVLFYFMSGYLNRSVRSLWGRRIFNPFLLSIVTRITLLPIWLILLYFALRLLGLSTLGATLIGGTGVLGIVFGLAFKGIAENYLAGLLLASRSPFTRGDLIQIGQYKGYVQNLNMRGTTIIDFNGNLILIPNIMVIQSVVENQSANPNTRTNFMIGIGYQDSITRAQDLIIESLTSVEGVLADPVPSVVVNDLGSTRVELKVRLWFNVKEDREMRVRSRAMIKAKETLLANGFSLPNETRELIFTQPLKIENVEHTQSAKEISKEREFQIKQQAVSNLAEPESLHATKDPSPEEMLKQAEENPLPMNVNKNDLLKK